MLYGVGKLNDPGAIVQPGQMAHMEQVGTAWQGLWKEYNRLVSDPSARLDPTVRQHYLQAADATHAQQVADYQKMRTETIKRGVVLLPGIEPTLYATDLTSTAQPGAARSTARPRLRPTGQGAAIAAPSPAVQAAVERESQASGVPVAHLLGLGAVESNHDPDATGPMTRFGWQAQGYGQLSPDTAQRFGVSDPYDLTQNLHGTSGAWKEAMTKAGGDPRRAYQQYYNPGASAADTDRFVRSMQHFETAAAAPRAAAPTPGASPPTARTSVTTKELQEAVDYANTQGRKTPDGQPFTVEYLKKYFAQQKMKVLP
jgi:soluble lytic murein transglycosylase-like protein